MVERSDEKGLEAIEELLEDDRKLAVSLDIDNPIKEPGPYMEPHPGVLEGIDRLVEVADAVTLNSGKPLGWQQEWRKRFSEQMPSLESIDMIGGMGTVAEVDGKIRSFGTNPDEALADFQDVQTNIVSTLAENGLKANMQNNRSYDVGVTRVEAENGEPHSRGYSRANPLFSDKTTPELYSEHFEEIEGFDIAERYEREYSTGTGGITFEPTQENVGYLSEVARLEEPFIGLRYERDGEEVVFYRDEEDRDIEDHEVTEELEHAIQDTGKDWNVTHHDDGGTEYWKPGIGKEEGLERYLDLKFNEDAVAIHIGDSRSDRMEGDRTMTIPQAGTELYDIMQPDHGLEPRDVADFSDMVVRAAGEKSRKQSY